MLLHWKRTVDHLVHMALLCLVMILALIRFLQVLRWSPDFLILSFFGVLPLALRL